MLPEGEYWLHLRKSRADLEAESRGEGETLEKHKKALFAYARKNSISVTRIYAEIISGESLIHRPEMLKMLKDLEAEKPKGILVMDYDRLGRGDKLDQGLIERALKEANVLIVSPSEIIDLNTDAGELTADVKGLFARMELRQINKRMQGGRRRSVESGNYIGTRPPFGYDIHKNEKSERYLVPNPEQAPIVRQIFDWYVNGKLMEDGSTVLLGSNKIANELNNIGIKTYTGKPWEASTVLNIIKNAVYVGRIQWGKKETKKSKEPGKRRDVRTRDEEEWIDVRGKHDPLVSDELYNKAQEILKGKYHVPYHLENGITNPLAGIIRCGKCGNKMILRPYDRQQPHLMCVNQQCDNKSARFEYVENKLIEALDLYITEYVHKWGKRNKSEPLSIDIKKSVLTNLERELKDLESQKLKLHDLLERGVYDDETYLERSQSLANRIDETKRYIDNAEKELKMESTKEKAQKDHIPNLKSVVKSYKSSKDPAVKNQHIKSILHYATYTKEKNQRNDEFTLRLQPKIR